MGTAELSILIGVPARNRAGVADLALGTGFARTTTLTFGGRWETTVRFGLGLTTWTIFAARFGARDFVQAFDLMKSSSRR